MNGSSSSGRHSSVSESSDGSFFTDADFASAVAAAAQSSGMNVVGSTVTDPRAGKKIVTLQNQIINIKGSGHYL
jgi:hypothetical protein